MSSLEERSIGCPYCGETIDVLLDAQQVGEQYVEDCQVCCRPIVFFISEEPSGDLRVTVHGENDVF